MKENEDNLSPVDMLMEILQGKENDSREKTGTSEIKEEKQKW